MIVKPVDRLIVSPGGLPNDVDLYIAQRALELTKAAVADGDVRRLSSISGIGKRTAERIVVDLRDKLGDGEAFESVSGGITEGGGDMKGRDAVMALVALGFRQDVGRKMVDSVLRKDGLEELSIEELIKKALGK